MLAVVAAVAPDVVDLVTGEGKRALHFLVGHPPVAAIDVEVVGAVLEENADRLGSYLRIERRVFVAAAQADVRADRAEHAAESVGTFPRRRERTDRAAARAADGSGRSPFVETWIARPSAVVLVFRPREAFLRAETGRNRGRGRRIQRLRLKRSSAVRVGRLHPPGMMNTPMSTGISFLAMRFVEDRRRVEADAVLADIHAGRLARVVLLAARRPKIRASCRGKFSSDRT